MGPLLGRKLPPLSSRETWSSSVQDLPQVGVNSFERCVETDWACWLDRIAQGKQVQDTNFLLHGDEGVDRQ